MLFLAELSLNRVRTWALTARPWICSPCATVMEIPKFPPSWSHHSFSLYSSLTVNNSIIWETILDVFQLSDLNVKLLLPADLTCVQQPPSGRYKNHSILSSRNQNKPAPLPNVCPYILFLFSFPLATTSFVFKKTQLLNPTCAFCALLNSTSACFWVSVVIWPGW